MNSDNPTPDEEIVDRHVEQLLEHFDSVRIFVTKHTGGKDLTAALSRGGGNWYAQYGGVMEWKTKQDESARVTERPSNEGQEL